QACENEGECAPCELLPTSEGCDAGQSRVLQCSNGCEYEELEPCTDMVVCTDEGSDATCGDGMDNDCDDLPDCADPDCSGVGECAACGQVSTVLRRPVLLPDGEGAGSCSTRANCGADELCIEIDSGESECRQPYRSTIDLQGFGDAVFESPDDIVSVCVTMEHSWLRDLEVSLEAPNGEIVRLHEFGGRSGGEIYLGEANDCDTADAPSPGTGARYCWSPGASRPTMLRFAETRTLDTAESDCAFGADVDQMPPGEYGAADSWRGFDGTALNGEWSLLITDLWAIDNGYLFDWSIAFASRLVEDCTAPLER
ncbi:MAG: proprotein convertase P-domain-containing protein, partial [Myxococcota bacterium]